VTSATHAVTSQVLEIRKHHNNIKRDLILRVVPAGASVLDVGCGNGGDLQKWHAAKVKNLVMCDPGSLEEVKSRHKNLKLPMKVQFIDGDIRRCPMQQFDIVAYNFSLHFIFETRALFETSVKEIRSRLRVGGRLIGVIPDSEHIIMDTPFEDPVSAMDIQAPVQGGFGEHLLVYLAKTPYFKDGVRRFQRVETSAV